MSTSNASNSANMTVAEKLALKIKDGPLGDLINQDDLAAIAKDAVERAFFQPQKIPGDYGRYETKDPAIIIMAREYLSQQIREAVKPLLEDLVASAEFRDLIIRAAITAIPEILRTYGTSLANNSMMESYGKSMEQLNMAIHNMGRSS